jgi:hypothetical protein
MQKKHLTKFNTYLKNRYQKQNSATKIILNGVRLYYSFPRLVTKQRCPFSPFFYFVLEVLVSVAKQGKEQTKKGIQIKREMYNCLYF